MKTEVLIIGAGPAGVSAGIQLKRLGHHILLIDKTGTPGGLLKEGFEIQNCPFLERPMSGDLIARRFQQYLDTWNINIIKDEIQTIDMKEQYFYAKGHEQAFESRSIIIATGTKPNTIELQGIHGILNTKAFYSVSQAQEKLKSAKSVTIIGGGEASFDFALTCSVTYDLEVDLIIRANNPKVKGQLRERVFKDNNINIRTNTIINEINKHNNQLVLSLKNINNYRKLQLSTDILLIAIGRKPLLPTFPISLKQRQGFYIIGDARLGTLGQATIAAGEGLFTAMEVSKWIYSQKL